MDIRLYCVDVGCLNFIISATAFAIPRICGLARFYSVYFVTFNISDEETTAWTLEDRATLEIFTAGICIACHGSFGISHEELGLGWHLKVCNILL